jgi:hypothetical protein
MRVQRFKHLDVQAVEFVRAVDRENGQALVIAA